ncbi:MAG: hypothetical protein HYZ57_01545 [Acidobacteria bacterium]|nr:hypothetical protein [Acidobacteriota bacterium]
MLVNFSKILGVAAAASLLSMPPWLHQARAQGQASQGGQTAQGQTPGAPKKEWKDRAEYDLYDAITKEQNGQKKLDLLNTWKQKYPSTAFRQERLLLYINTYQALGQTAKIIETAKELLTIDPKDFTALYWVAFLTPSMGDNSPSALDTAEKAARGMLANLDATFAKEKKPQQMNDAQWAKARSDMEAIAHKAIGWVEMVRKNNPAAEQALLASLKANAAQGDVAYWLANVIAAEKNVERYPTALFYWARAAAYDGPGSLAPAGRTDVDKYLQKAYSGYHGDTSGLDELKKTAKANATPPAGFKIKSIKDIEEEKVRAQQKIDEADPQGALWRKLKAALIGAEGEQYFESNMKDAKLPEKSLRGKVVSQTPTRRPKEVQLALSDGTTPEVTLKFETPLPNNADPGTVIEFTGVAKSYTKEPFMVTFEAEKADISGWPAATAAKKPAARKPAARKPARRR